MHLKINQAHAIRKKLIEDRKSTYEELLDHFVNVIGIGEGLAKQFLCTRSVYLNDPAFAIKKKVRKPRKKQPLKIVKDETVRNDIRVNTKPIPLFGYIMRLYKNVCAIF